MPTGQVPSAAPHGHAVSTFMAHSIVTKGPSWSPMLAAAGRAGSPTAGATMALTDEQLARQSIDSIVASCLRGDGPQELLRLPRSASRQACRMRYLQLALRLHPDKTSHPRAGDAFRAVEEAFRALENT